MPIQIGFETLVILGVTMLILEIIPGKNKRVAVIIVIASLLAIGAGMAGLVLQYNQTTSATAVKKP